MCSGRVACPESAPVTVKLYLNRTSFSFDDAESIEATQVLELTADDYQADKVTLLKVRSAPTEGIEREVP